MERKKMLERAVRATPTLVVPGLLCLLAWDVPAVAAHEADRASRRFSNAAHETHESLRIALQPDESEAGTSTSRTPAQTPAEQRDSKKGQPPNPAPPDASMKPFTPTQKVPEGRPVSFPVDI